MMKVGSRGKKSGGSGGFASFLAYDTVQVQPPIALMMRSIYSTYQS
jgi:hypothetical protein